MLLVSPSWRQHISDWERGLRAAGRPATTRGMRTYHLRRFASDHPSLQLRHTTEDHLITWLADHDWAPETRRGYRASLRLFFSWAHAQSRIATNPAHNLPTVRPPRAQPRPAPDDVVRMALTTGETRVRLMVWILANTGMRRAEVARLHTRQLEQSAGGPQLRIVGKGGHERVVPVSERLGEVLGAFPTGYLFPGRIDGHISPAHRGKLVSRALGPGWTAHTLRHRYASSAYAVERDLRAVQELLGHAQVSTTQIYTVVPDDSRRRAAEGAEIGIVWAA